MDVNTWNVVSQTCQIKPQNTVVVSVITPYQLARLLTALITLVDSIQMAAMVDSGAMGNFIHPQFVKEHELVTKTRTPLIMNNVNGHLLLHVDQQVEVWMKVGVMISLIFPLFSLFSHSALFCCFRYTPLHHQPTIHQFSSISSIAIAHRASQLRCVDRCDLIAYMKRIRRMTRTDTIETHSHWRTAHKSTLPGFHM